MYTLNAITAPDQYQSGSTIEINAPLKRVVVDVSNQAIYWQLKIPVSGGTGAWDNVEAYMLPGSRRLPGSEGCVGVRIRAAVPAASLPAGSLQAIVTVMALD